MSKNYKKPTKIQDTDNSRFGKYKEGVGGGGSPNGTVNDGPHGHGVNSDYRKNNNDTMQPRTGDGKFTYKSVNGQSIDPKYGPSRGKTVNPLLTGGENGVMIEDVEKDFNNKSGHYWDTYKDKWYQEGDEEILKGEGRKGKYQTHVAAKAIWNVARERYDSVKGEFEGESEVFDKVKSGRRGKEEIAATSVARKNGGVAPVLDSKTGGFKQAPNTTRTPSQIYNPTPTRSIQFTPSSAPGNIPGKWSKVVANAQSYMNNKSIGGSTINASNGNVTPNVSSSVNAAAVSAPANNNNVATPAAPKAFSKKPIAAPGAPKQLQDFSADVSLAKSNPNQFAQKYRNEVGAMLHIIRQKHPNFKAGKLLNLIGSGKIKSINQLKSFFGVK